MKELEITVAEWKKYKDKLRRISEEAAEQMQAYAESHQFKISQEMIDYAYALSTKYGEASAELACEMYDELAEYWNAGVPPAEPAPTATYQEVAKGMYGSIKQSPGGNLLSSVTYRLVKQAGADTTMKNAIRDGAYWAWIPTGDTCAFCITLASRGWQRASKKVLSGDHAEHIHAHCDCTFAIAFKPSDTKKYPFYDPDKYYKRYMDANGDINAMRRDIYPDIAKARNARRKILYAIKKQRSVAEDMPFVYNGENLYIPAGAEFTNVTTIAGKGTKVAIHDVKRLVATYGGKAEDWKKRVGKVESDRFLIDIHWYEKDDGILIEEKIKEVIEK